MGAWGAGLYQDDVTCDVREDYLDRLRIGYTNVEATQDVINQNIDSIEDEEDGPLLWFALADTQWKYGRLLPEVRDVALKYIESGQDLKRWEESKSLYNKRKKVLEDLREKLNSVQPSEKKVRKLTIHKATWKVGDVLLYRIKDEQFKDNKWYQKYVIFKVIGIAKSNIGSLPREYSDEQNIVGLCNWVGDSVSDFKVIRNLDFIKQKNGVGKIIDVLRSFSFRKKELQKLDFQILLNDEGYYKNSKTVMQGQGIIWSNVYTLDSTIILALEEAEKNGVLIDES